MRDVHLADLTELVSRLSIESNINLREDVRCALEGAVESERSERGREVIEQILQNARAAERERIPLCQDTGYVTAFLEIGREIRIVGASSLREAVDEGVRRGYERGNLRASVVDDVCFERTNTGDNTPAAIHVELVEGDGFSVTMFPKGAGSDNASRLGMLGVAEGVDGAESFVADAVVASAANACPPVIVGVGIGSSFDGVALLAKKALLRTVGRSHPDARVAGLERRVLERVNRSGVGPGGLGGTVTALAVHVETAPCHMASFPVAVNLSCHVLRSASGRL
ncbi:MAG: fumarate hydratase [Actinobacteria bacterium]|nr:MAG: fumarate hydratase [Actinomycetota bacterium]